MNHLRSYPLFLAIGVVLLLGASQASAGVALLTPGDPTLAIDLDAIYSSTGTCESGYPAAESPMLAFDGSSGSKYLNTGGANSGFIVTLNYAYFATSSAQTITSFAITTANDEEGRDPASWILYGTNDAIASTDNTFGNSENWTYVAEGTLSLPSARYTTGDVVSVNNSTAYLSYKMVFPTLKTSGALMQLADIYLYSTEMGISTCADFTDPILAIDVDGQEPTWSGSSYPNTQEGFYEDPAKCIDGIVGTDPSTLETKGTKYLNFGGQNSGFIVTPSVGKTLVNGFQITTADDNNLYPDRTPTSWALYGTDDPITSVDNSNGGEENWTLIGQGEIALDTTPYAVSDIFTVENSTYYTSYRMVFPTLYNAGTIMQIEEIQFYGTIEGSVTDHAGDANRDGKVDDLDASILAANWQRTGDATWETADFNDDGSVNDLDASILAANWQYGVGSSAVPEPGTLVLLAGLALLGLARWARRK